MSDPKFPPNPLPIDWQSRDTEPPPRDDDTIELMRELRGALANVGELMSKLDLRLCQTMLAVVTVEHKINTLREDFDRHVGEAAE